MLEVMSPTRTDVPAPPRLTWLAAVVVAFAPIAVEPAKVAWAFWPTAVELAAFATDALPMAVAALAGCFPGSAGALRR